MSSKVSASVITPPPALVPPKRIALNLELDERDAKAVADLVGNVGVGAFAIVSDIYGALHRQGVIGQVANTPESSIIRTGEFRFKNFGESSPTAPETKAAAPAPTSPLAMNPKFKVGDRVYARFADKDYPVGTVIATLKPALGASSNLVMVDFGRYIVSTAIDGNHIGATTFSFWGECFLHLA